MRTLSISISIEEYNKFGIRGQQLCFSDLVDIIRKELAKQALEKSVLLAEKYGLSSMTIEDITNEVSAVRKGTNGRN